MSLATDGFIVAAISPHDADDLRGALAIITQALEECHDEGTKHKGMAMENLQTRSQLRYIAADVNQDLPESELDIAVSTASRVLAGVIDVDSADGEQTSDILDAFYYSPSTSPTSPCPAHTDPGVLTVVCDNVSALEVQSAGGIWRRLELAENEVALIAGRQHSSAPACIHRVAPVTTRRCSLVYERRLADAKAIQGLQSRQLLAAAANERPPEEDEQYARAAKALAALGARHSTQHDAPGGPLSARLATAVGSAWRALASRSTMGKGSTGSEAVVSGGLALGLFLLASDP